MKNNKSILLVEDDAVDVMSVKRAFKDLNITNRLNVVGNGEEALSYLKNSNGEHPCVILLDINMPRMGGIEFLKIAKGDSHLKSIPVIVFTTSKEERDRFDSFNLGVAGYMVKPVDYKQFVEVIRAIDLYWTISELP